MTERVPTERQHAILLLGAAFILYLPFIFLGYGANDDSARMAETGPLFIVSGTYTPTRYPGFPVHEIPAAVLNHIGGATLSNAGTLAMALLAVHAFMGLLTHYGLPNRTPLTVALIANPVFWTTATYTIDYVWSLSLLLIGFNLMRRRRYVWSALALGLATGSRVSSFGFAAVILCHQFITARADRRQLALCAAIVAGIGVLAHASTFWRFGFLRLYFGDWNAPDFAINFLYGNLMFVGPQALMGLGVIVASFVWLRSRNALSVEWRWLAALCVTIIAGYELLFLLAPIQVGYLLPALPALLLLLGIVLRDRRRLLFAWVVASVSASVITINVVNVMGNVRQVESSLPPVVSLDGPQVHGRSTTLSGGLFVRWGYVVSDAAARIAYGK